MSIDSGPEALPRKRKRTAKRDVESDISPGLREHITRAAREIRAEHNAELADVVKADRAGRLFRSIIRPNGKPSGSFQETSGASGGIVDSLADEFGALLSESIRTGTSLLAIPLTALAQEWMATIVGPAAKPEAGTSSAEESVPGERLPAKPSAVIEKPDVAAETGVRDAKVPEAPDAGTDEAMLLGVFRQFMPMLVTSLRQGGDGHGLAGTVITLFGRPTYDQACGLGRDNIMQIVKANPDLWAQVAPIEAEFSRFLDDFIGYDAWTKARARQADEPPQLPVPGR